MVDGVSLGRECSFEVRRPTLRPGRCRKLVDKACGAVLGFLNLGVPTLSFLRHSAVLLPVGSATVVAPESEVVASGGDSITFPDPALGGRQQSSVALDNAGKPGQGHPYASRATPA